MEPDETEGVAQSIVRDDIHAPLAVFHRCEKLRYYADEARVDIVHGGQVDYEPDSCKISEEFVCPSEDLLVFFLTDACVKCQEMDVILYRVLKLGHKRSGEMEYAFFEKEYHNSSVNQRKNIFILSSIPLRIRSPILPW